MTAENAARVVRGRSLLGAGLALLFCAFAADAAPSPPGSDPIGELLAKQGLVNPQPALPVAIGVRLAETPGRARFMIELSDPVDVKAFTLTNPNRVVLDMLAPWECLQASAEHLAPGGVIVVYVATTTQMSMVVETLRVQECWTEPRAEESIVRTWHLDGLAVRPDHRMIGHTGFLITGRRLADGTTLPPRRRRPAPGAYGEDYSGPGALGSLLESSRTE